MTKFTTIALAMTSVLALTAFAPEQENHAQHSETQSAPHWSYEGETGPENWGELSPAFEACSVGTVQSPIDMPKFAQVTHQKLAFHYQASGLRVLHNGHTYQANYDAGSYIMLDDKRYDLLQFHFHSPSENTIEKEHAAMDVHLVHRSEDGALAVVGVMMMAGDPNTALEGMWNVMPAHASEETTFAEQINAADILPVNKAHYTFSGSLTTPPCSEGVHWNVMVDPITISEGQVQKFLNAVGENARPVQMLNGRTLSISQN